MAIGVTEGVAEIVSSSNTTTYDFGSFTPATDSVLVVFAYLTGTNAGCSIVNVSGTSLTWNQSANASASFGTSKGNAFYAVTPSSTAASVYRVDCTGDAATGCIAYMFQVTGADLANPLYNDTWNSNGAGGTNANTGTLLVASDTNNAYLSGWMGSLSSSNPANVSTPPTSWTEIGDNGYSTPTLNASAAFRAGGETGTGAKTFTNASTPWWCNYIEIKAASGGGGGGGDDVMPFTGGGYYPT